MVQAQESLRRLAHVLIHQTIFDNELIRFLSTESRSETACVHRWFIRSAAFWQEDHKTGAINAETGAAKCLTRWHNRRDFTEFETHPIRFFSRLWPSTTSVK
jgi:hypothetical protein